MRKLGTILIIIGAFLTINIKSDAARKELVYYIYLTPIAIGLILVAIKKKKKYS